MKIRNIQIPEWDGRESIVLHQAEGFNFCERRYKHGITTEPFCFLYNDSIDKKKALEIMKMLLEEIPDDSP